MERLTKRFADGTAYTTNYFRTHNGVITTHSGEIVDKLAEYEDAEEQGLLLRLPCKVGDTVFIPMKPYILEYDITSFEISQYGTWLMHLEHKEEQRMFRTVELGESIGKTVFLTREEAEAALAEKGGAE